MTQITMMDVKNKVALVTMAVLLGFGTISWIVALGGLAASQDACKGYCETAFRFQWWSLWFEPFVVVATAAVAFLESLRPFKMSFVGVMAVQTFSTIYSADVTNNFQRDVLGKYGSPKTKTMLAGFVMLSMFNLVFMVLASVDLAALGGPAMGPAAPAPSAPTSPTGPPPKTPDSPIIVSHPVTLKAEAADDSAV